MISAIPDTAETVVRASHVPGPAQGRWRYADYAALPDDGNHYEIIAGVLYLAPAPIPEHEMIVALVIARLVNTLADTGLGRVMASPDIDLGDVVVRPDAVVVLNANLGVIERTRLVGPPDLVVEVASPATAAYDRNASEGKRGAYGRAGVAEYWIVDPLTQTVEVLVLRGITYDSLGVLAGDAALPSRVLGAHTITAAACFPHDSIPP